MTAATASRVGRAAAREAVVLTVAPAEVMVEAARVAVGRAAVAVAGAREDAWADTGAELAGVMEEVA